MFQVRLSGLDGPNLVAVSVPCGVREGGRTRTYLCAWDWAKGVGRPHDRLAVHHGGLSHHTHGAHRWGLERKPQCFLQHTHIQRINCTRHRASELSNQMETEVFMEYCIQCNYFKHKCKQQIFFYEIILKYSVDKNEQKSQLPFCKGAQMYIATVLELRGIWREQNPIVLPWSDCRYLLTTVQKIALMWWKSLLHELAFQKIKSRLGKTQTTIRTEASPILGQHLQRFYLLHKNARKTF